MQHAQAERTQNDVSDDIMLARELEVAERIRDKSSMFTIRQVASIHRMSIPYLRQFAERHGITFVGTDGSRTKRISSAVIARERRHTSTVVARSLTRKPVTSLDSEKITPELRERARRRDQESVNGFIESLRELSLTHTREEATKEAGISPTFMRRLAYDHELVFVGESAPVSQCASPAALKKLQGSLFRPNKKMKQATSRLIRNFVISDVQDAL
ncbi:hypothetical protein ACM7YY_31480 [Pseudomonas aeruginosa]